MAGIGLKIALGASIAAGGLGMIAFLASPDEPQRRVGLDPEPPQAESWKAEWIPGAMPQPPAADVEVPSFDADQGVGQASDANPSAHGSTGPVEDPYAG